MCAARSYVKQSESSSFWMIGVVLILIVVMVMSVAVVDMLASTVVGGDGDGREFCICMLNMCSCVYNNHVTFTYSYTCFMCCFSSSFAD